MKDKTQIEKGIKELRDNMKNPALPDIAKVKMREAIAVLEWVME